MSRVFIVLAACLWGTLSCGIAQNPVSHEVIFPASDLAWTVTVEPVKRTDTANPEGGLKSRKIDSIEAVRKGRIRRDTVRWNDGSTTEFWWLSHPPIALTEEAGSEGGIRAMKVSQLGPRRFDESTFSWVSGENYVGPDTFKGKKVQRYRLELPVEEGETSALHVLVNTETKQPLVWSDGVTNYVFDFDRSVPDEPLVLPSKFQGVLAQYEAQYAPAKKRGKR